MASMYEVYTEADPVPIEEDGFAEFVPYDQEWFEPEDAVYLDPSYLESTWTEFPLLRQAVNPDLAELGDEDLAGFLWQEGVDAAQLEDFMQVLGRIGTALGNALPAIGTGAATGATVGSVVPGVGTGIGAAVGGVLGGLGSVLGQLAGPTPRPRPPSRPGATPPTQVRPGVTRATPGPSRPAATPPVTPADTPAASAQTLLGILTNPRVIQALTALTLGPNGRQSVTVAGREVPTTAFAELVSELATEATYASEGDLVGPEQYLAGAGGEALVDLASPPERAGGLIGLLAAEALGAELPFEEPLLSSPWEDAPDWVGDEEWVDESWDETAGPEAAPAVIAVAGTLISGANLGLGVFDRLERHLLSGKFAVTSHAASYIHNPSPRGLTVHTRVFTFPVYAHHPRIGIGTQTFWFRLTLEYDGFNIRRASIVEDRGRSSTLVSSDFAITFAPSAWSAANEPVAAIAYNVSGRWDPVGRGDEGFDGRLIIDAQGRLRSLRVSSPQRWVWHGSVTHTGGGPVPRPGTGRHEFKVEFDRPGKTTLPSASTRALHGFYTGLPQAVRDEIAAGRIPIRITGRASTTASVERNQTIGRQRAAAVAAVFRDLAGTAARIEIASHGELGARTPDNQEDPAERRADILIEYALFR